MPTPMRADSTEFVSTTFTVNHDPASATVEVAVPQANTPPTSWYPAEVVKIEPTVAGRWIVTFRILIGPAGGLVALTAADYDFTSRITDSPETPVRKHGILKITST